MAPDYRAHEQATFDARAARLYLAGYSTYQVAETLGVSQGQVARSLRRSETPRRPWGFGGSCGKKKAPA